MKAVQCDSCGKTGALPGLAGWFQISRHPDGVDTTQINQDPRGQWDVCSADCVKALVIR